MFLVKNHSKLFLCCCVRSTSLLLICCCLKHILITSEVLYQWCYRNMYYYYYYWWLLCRGLMQNDPDKQSYMPKDGTVHELTSNVRHVLYLLYSVLTTQCFLRPFTFLLCYCFCQHLAWSDVENKVVSPEWWKCGKYRWWNKNCDNNWQLRLKLKLKFMNID